MPIDLKRFQELKSNVDRRRTEADRAEGALSQVMARLKGDWECDTVDEADEKLKGMRVERDKVKSKVKAGLDEFESEWGRKLG